MEIRMINVISVTILLAHLTVRVTVSSDATYRGIGKEKSFTVVGKYANYTWPLPQLSAIIPGDVMLGALHMIHERSKKYECGPIMSQGGIQALEVMLYTLRKVNDDPDFLPGFKLGILAKDDCDGDIYGLKQSVTFIRGMMGESGCEDGVECKIISGVMAASSSDTSIQVANLLKLFHIPQVSFFSTSDRLGNRNRFPYFLRTIPSDVNQAAVMVKLVKMFGWKYVSVVYEESTYGFRAFSLLQDYLRRNDVCIAATAKLVKDSGVAGKEAYLSIIDVLIKRRKARGVIIFGSDQEVGAMMKAARTKRVTGWFTWIGSDGWGARELAYEGFEAQVEGAVTVQPLAHPVEGFDDYFKSLTPENNHDNPWFIEYWEEQFKCKYPRSRWTPFNENYNMSNMCTGREVYNKDYPYKVERQLQYVSDSLLVFAHAFKNLHKELCGQKRGLCPAINPVDGYALKEALYKVNFTGLSNINFQFTKNGDGPNKYRILNFRRFADGSYKWITVGYYINGNFTHMNTSMLQFRLDEPKHPESICSKPCGPGEYQERIDECCWYCKGCGPSEYLASKNTCKDCPWGTFPTPNKTRCIKLTPKYLSYSDGVAIGAMVVASLGIIVTTFVVVVFVIYRETAVVKASGVELSFVLLVGILLCYAITFVLISKPSAVTCGIQRFVIGICFTLCYAAILTKTDRISRIFRAGKRTAKRPKFISPKSQLIICFGLIAVELFVVGIWLFWAPPTDAYIYTDKINHVFLRVCRAAIGFSYAIALSYPLLLIIICTVYAILTRKIPEAFNESKFIGFTMYTTCIIWLAFIPIYLSTGNNLTLRLATLAFSISLSATVALVCMFTPKLYIIILRPERNVRQSMLSSKTSSITYKSNLSSRVDSSNRSDGEMEMSQRLKSSGSLSSGLSWSTSATQTYINGNNISTQTCDGCGYVLSDQDVLL